jgi:hypothetical protein
LASGDENRLERYAHFGDCHKGRGKHLDNFRAMKFIGRFYIGPQDLLVTGTQEEILRHCGEPFEFDAEEG